MKKSNKLYISGDLLELAVEGRLHLHRLVLQAQVGRRALVRELHLVRDRLRLERVLVFGEEVAAAIGASTSNGLRGLRAVLTALSHTRSMSMSNCREKIPLELKL